MQVGVLFSRDGFLALNKPPGMCSQGPKDTDIPELWEMVRSIYPTGFVAHRIDKFTSGVNLAGVSKTQIGYLARHWHSITQKTYLAITRCPKWDETIVDRSLNGKSAITGFRVLERSGSFALMECRLLQNGRTHQIRKHLKSVGSPIVGDRKYNGPVTEARLGQMLHAWRMEVRLPDESGKPGPWTTIQAAVPDDFRSFDFNWHHWDSGANDTLEDWVVPTAGWRN
ncbi:MAG: RNA pseudouridine synthase [Candidatus Yanofskybacteria bacterium]|nr:RNA pseudouridine synthase [Candidatus Yanofskybacteria bacterium]